ncbi:hypothetical protein BDP27DRAFT_1358681 [Rhodocollybia butyracea]|uniref:Uncharacterized protein n=1 Tax=Rhodocollybia butyracea TaxID=206335 RepID=A0A9P5PZI5_9AGAR|nr:hypothetical protein BDP27DRAFT_1358681 [Rhodocollybia butyracea]
MVLIEVDRDFTNHKILLGEHRWAEFLQNPNEEEKPCCTRIFYSNHSDYRSWNTISVQDKWFDEWSINNSIVKQPYPLTHWCQVPVEGATNKKMCRMLPVSLFPPPAKESKPTVGSKAWAQSTIAPKPDSLEAQRSTWNSGRPSSVNKVPSHSKAASTARSQNSVSVNSSATPKAPSTPKAGQSARRSNPPLVAGAKNARRATPKLAAATQHPPDLSASRANPPSAPPGLARNTSSGSGSSNIASNVAADRAVMANAQYDDLLAGTGHLTVSDGTPFGIALDEDLDYESSVASWETPHSNGDAIYSAEAENIKQNLEELEGKLECSVHGAICPRGICVVYSALRRKNERAKQNARGSGVGKKRKSKSSSNRDDASGEMNSVNTHSRAASVNSSVHITSSSASATEPVTVPFDHNNEDSPW